MVTEEEFVVSEDMIDAGYGAYCGHEPGCDDTDRMLANVFREMYRVFCEERIKS